MNCFMRDRLVGRLSVFGFPNVLMRQPIIALNILALIGVSMVGCSKSPSEVPISDLPVVTTPLTTNDLGVLEVSPNVENRVSIGGGTDCVITPAVVGGGGGKLEIGIELQKIEKGKTNSLGSATADDYPGNKITRQVSATTAVSFTLKLKSQ